ncbi:MAG: hypothetical protein KF768_12905 [Phycisphaeraceae bacterium]|nr:hypothetical protein [Phycisphaeraceae bacterium]
MFALSGAMAVSLRGVWPWPLLFAGSCVLLVVLLRVVLWGMGWDRLARRYPDRGRGPVSWHRRLASIAIGRPYFSLNNCVRWSADDLGLRLGIEPPLNICTPRVWIPWSEVARLEVEPGWGRTYRIEGTDPAGVPVFLPVAIVEGELAVRASMRGEEALGTDGEGGDRE